MFCPKCGQQQADEVRFCSRCGFALAGVSELIMRGGQLPAWTTAAPVGSVAERRKSPKLIGIKQGARMMFISFFLIPMIAIMHKAIGMPRQFVLLGVLLFMAGMMRLFYSLLFAESTASASDTQTAYAPPMMPPLGAVRQDMLPPAQGTPAYAYRPPQVHTAEMQPPPSVTDHTTRLLDRQGGEERDER
ncbi:MAG: zinc-ribbon domain-containing protein [Pyrinomonadaceae bacterium]